MNAATKRLTHAQAHEVLKLLEGWKGSIEHNRMTAAAVLSHVHEKVKFTLSEPQLRGLAKDVGIRWHAGQGKSRVNKEIVALKERVAAMEKTLKELALTVKAIDHANAINASKRTAEDQQLHRRLSDIESAA